MTLKSAFPSESQNHKFLTFLKHDFEAFLSLYFLKQPMIQPIRADIIYYK